jgi:hypothetical protein
MRADCLGRLALSAAPASLPGSDQSSRCARHPSRTPTSGLSIISISAPAAAPAARLIASIWKERSSPNTVPVLDVEAPRRRRRMQPPQRPSSSRACFCYSKARPTPSPNSHGAATTDRISELQELRISELQKRVQAACVEHTRIEAALDSEAPKAALVALVLEQEDKLRQELAQLTLSALQRRALASGVDRDAVDAALDGEGREALQALILESEARDSPAPRPGPEHAAADADSSAEPAAARVHLSDAHARAGGEGQPSDALRRELEPLRLKQLRLWRTPSTVTSRRRR